MHGEDDQIVPYADSAPTTQADVINLLEFIETIPGIKIADVSVPVRLDVAQPRYKPKPNGCETSATKPMPSTPAARRLKQTR